MFCKVNKSEAKKIDTAAGEMGTRVEYWDFFNINFIIYRILKKLFIKHNPIGRKAV